MVNNFYDSPLVKKIVNVLKDGFETNDRKKI